MSKKKRRYYSDVPSTPSLHLHDPALSADKVQDHNDRKNPKKQLFSPELIARLTERIKKL